MIIKVFTSVIVTIYPESTPQYLNLKLQNEIRKVYIHYQFKFKRTWKKKNSFDCGFFVQLKKQNNKNCMNKHEHRTFPKRLRKHHQHTNKHSGIQLKKNCKLVPYVKKESETKQSISDLRIRPQNNKISATIIHRWSSAITTGSRKHTWSERITRLKESI